MSWKRISFRAKKQFKSVDKQPERLASLVCCLQNETFDIQPTAQRGTATISNCVEIPSATDTMSQVAKSPDVELVNSSSDIVTTIEPQQNLVLDPAPAQAEDIE